MTVAGSQRWTRDRPCPICGGWPGLTRGLCRRCEGYLSSCGRFARCARPEHAGALPAGPDGLFAHYLQGRCRCGQEHGAPAAWAPRPQARPAAVRPGLPIRTVSAALDAQVRTALEHRGLGREVPSMYATLRGEFAFRYPGRSGDLLVKVRSTTDKSRMFWSPAGAGARPLYGWHRVADVGADQVVIVEGELDLHSLRAVGIFSVVSVPDGAHTRLTPELLAPLERFARVVLAVDHDPEGEQLAGRLAAALGPRRCRRAWFGEHKDANDALRAGWRRGHFERALGGAAAEAA